MALKTKNTFISANSTKSDGYRENNSFSRTQLLITHSFIKNNVEIEPILYLLGSYSQIPSSLNEYDFINSPSKAASNWAAISGYESSRKAIIGLNVSHQQSIRTKHIYTIYSRYYDGNEKRPFNNLDDKLNALGLSYQLNYSFGRFQSITHFAGSQEYYSWDSFYRCM